MQMKTWIESIGLDPTSLNGWFIAANILYIVLPRQIRLTVFVLIWKIQGKFQAFYQYAKTFNSDEFDYEELKNSDYIFMRWKVSVHLFNQGFFYGLYSKRIQYISLSKFE